MKCTFAEFAIICGRSDSWVTAHAADGMPCTRPEKNGLAGEIDTAIALPWIFERLQSARATEGNRDRLLEAQAVRVELDNAKRSGELIPVRLAEQLLATSAGAIVTAMEAVPGRLASELAATKDPSTVLARLRESVREVRNAAARAVEHFGEHASADPLSRADAPVVDTDAAQAGAGA